MKNSKRTWLIRTCALAALGICFSAGTLNARELRATFTLPYEASWGGVILPAGDYSLSFESMPSWVQGPAIVLRQGERGVCVLLPISGEERKSLGKSRLVILRGEEKAVVRMLYLSETGTEYRFKIPQGYEVSARMISRADKPIKIESIPVTVSGK